MSDHVCPHCGSAAGYIERTICRLTRWCSFDGAGHDSEIEHISGGQRLHCAECKRDVTKFVNAIKNTPAAG